MRIVTEPAHFHVQPTTAEGSPGFYVPMIVVMAPDDWSRDPEGAVAAAEAIAARLEAAVADQGPDPLPDGHEPFLQGAGDSSDEQRP